MTVETSPSFCRLCHNACAILVEVEGGKAVRVTGDRSNPVFAGYTCVKGRAQPQFLRHPERLYHSMKRMEDGSYSPIDVQQAMDEVADRLEQILARRGPRAIAGYYGTMLMASVVITPMFTAFMDAIESPMRFTPNTIDKPGKMIAKALHGSWMAPPQGYHDPEVALLIGMNPPISYKGVPAGNPAKWISDAIRRGMKLIVIDPRRTDVARRAFLHLQPRPGEDVAIVAGFLRVILEEGLYDKEFVAENVHGVDDLRAAVEPFTSPRVAARAGVAEEDLVTAARTFASGRGYAVAGTGPNMSGPGTLVEYLVLALDTLCGHYLRAGEQVRNAPTLLPSMLPRAQASPPQPAFGFGEAMRVRGLTDTAAGLPTAVLPDEILLEGDGQVRALISCAGNPAAAWPDQLKSIEAMRQLELLVQIDPWMSATAKLAHYVIAPKMPLEVAGTTQMQLDVTSLGFTGYGLEDSYAQYSAPVVDPPPGSDLIEEWEFFWGVARRMGLQLSITKLVFWPIAPLLLDMEVKPATDELLKCLVQGSRVSLDEVKRHRHGALFPDPPQVVAPADLGWTGRLDVGNPDMMRDLGEIARALGSASAGTITSDHDYLRLIPRRVQHAYNSSHRDAATNHGKPYNPAFIHPHDVSRLGLVSGDIVEISSARASILAVVEEDATLREGLVSMTHGFGSLPDEDNRLHEVGSNTARLLDNDVNFQPYSGQPRMSNVPVSVRKWASTP